MRSLTPDIDEVATNTQRTAQLYEQEEDTSQYRKLRNIKLARELSEPSARTLQEQAQQVDAFKYNINKYTELISSKDTSPASKAVMKEYLRSYVSAVPKEFHAAAAAVLAYSPIDPETEAMERFEQWNPRPQKPVAKTLVNGVPTFTEERLPENEKAWAEYDFASVEWNLKRRMLADKRNKIDQPAEAYAPPKFIGGVDDKLWYKDHKTGQVSWISSKNLPEADVKTSVEKGWQTFNDILRSGMVIVGEPRYATMGETQVEIRQVKDITTGQTVIERKPLGPAEGKGLMPQVLDDAFAAFQLGVTSGKEFDKLPMRSKGIVTALKEIEDAKSDPKKQAQLIGTLNKITQQQYGYIVIRNSNEVENSWAQNWVPGVEKYTMAGGVYSALPVNREMVSFTGTDVAGKPQSGMFYYNDVLKMAIDARGKPIEATKGVSPGSKEALPNLRVEAPGARSKPPEAKPVKSGDPFAALVEEPSPGGRTDWSEIYKSIKSFVGKELEKVGQTWQTEETETGIKGTVPFVQAFNEAVAKKSRDITSKIDSLDHDAEIVTVYLIKWMKENFNTKGLSTLLAFLDRRYAEAAADAQVKLKGLREALIDMDEMLNKLGIKQEKK
jgi:hypothetical protein